MSLMILICGELFSENKLEDDKDKMAEEGPQIATIKREKSSV